MNNNERINNIRDAPFVPGDNFFLNNDEQNMIQNQNYNRRRELLFLFYFVLIFIAVRIWIIILSSDNQYVIILSAIFTGLIFALLCFRCRPFPQNPNPNNPIMERNMNDPLNDFHVFMLQAANNHHSRANNIRTDSALPMETYENLECFLYKNIKLSIAYERRRDAMGNCIPARANSDSIEDSSPPLFITRKQQAIPRSSGDISNRRRLSIDDESTPQGDIESLETIEEDGDVQDGNVPDSKIEEKTDVVPMQPNSARSDVSQDNCSTCSICLSDFQPQDLMLRLPCSHFYHKTCVSMWFSQHNSCPLCKQNVTVMLHHYYGITPEDLEEPAANTRSRAITNFNIVNNSLVLNRSVNPNTVVALNTINNNNYRYNTVNTVRTGGGAVSNLPASAAVGRQPPGNDIVI